MDTDGARVLLLAIGLQESALKHRRQIVGGKPVGPAKGLLQFERGGGCTGVLTHEASQDLARWVCRAQGVGRTAKALWNALEFDDALAFAAGRLLLYTDPQPLPAVDDAAGAWAYYIRVWRPGKPWPDKWAKNHALAREMACL